MIPPILLKRLGENVDRLITVEVNARGVLHALYPAARQLHPRPQDPVTGCVAAPSQFADLALLNGVLRRAGGQQRGHGGTPSESVPL